MKKRTGLWAVSAIAIAVLVVGVTVAFLATSSNPVINTFTVGAVTITLTETTGEEYHIVPGAAIEKDPAVTVVGGSEACWLFVEIEKTGAFDTFCSYEIADGWTSLAGHYGIYYRMVYPSTENAVFPVLKNDRISVSDTVTEELLNTVTENPTLNFTAYAVQSDGLETAHDAWQALHE